MQTRLDQSPESNRGGEKGGKIPRPQTHGVFPSNLRAEPWERSRRLRGPLALERGKGRDRAGSLSPPKMTCVAAQLILDPQEAYGLCRNLNRGLSNGF